MPAAPVEDLIGTWRVAAIPGVSLAYQVMIEKGWYGMRFNDQDLVDTLLISDPDGTRIFAADVFKVATKAAKATHLSQNRSEIETEQPMGRLRMIEYQGAVSAAMIYDRQPVIDYFRAIDDTAVLCAAEARGSNAIGYCVLQRST